MSPGDFGLSVLASWLANRFDAFTPKTVPGETAPAAMQSTGLDADEQGDHGLVRKRESRFKTFDSSHDLEALLHSVSEPVISILIEETPSTAYRLPSMVLESRVTGEWFVFPRMRMSFEGTGGGVSNAENTFNLIKQMGAKIGAWVVPQTILDDLDSGYIMWAEARSSAVPLLAVMRGDYSWLEIEENVKRFLRPSSDKTD